MASLLILLCLSLSCMLTCLKSPQNFVTLLVVQTFLCSLFMGFNGNVWYSYILFLVFLGGMLVIFVYISSLSSSIKVENKFKETKIIFLYAMVFMAILIYFDLEVSVTASDLFMSSESTALSFMTSKWNSILYMVVVMYLLLVLHNICLIMKPFGGPLRKMT